MPRRLIIGLLIVLILGILGGTVVLLMQRFGSDTAETPLTSVAPGTLPGAQTGQQVVVNPSGDDDNDGLSNAEEVLWRTIATDSDTDNDGYLDGAEVTAGHNPTIAAPNDKLPEGFVPGQDLSPLDIAPNAPIAVDQFFQDNLDLSGGNQNLTAEYQQRYPESERTPDTLAAFVKTKPIISKLPEPAPRATQAQATDGPLVLAEYLAVAGNLAVFSNRSTLAEAINTTYGGGDPGLLIGMAVGVRHHQEQLIQLPVPPVAIPLHKLLLGYTELLAATYDQMAQYNTDPVKSVHALYQLEQIDQQYIPFIQHEATRLQSISNQLKGSVQSSQAEITHP